MTVTVTYDQKHESTLQNAKHQGMRGHGYLHACSGRRWRPGVLPSSSHRTHQANRCVSFQAKLMFKQQMADNSLQKRPLNVGMEQSQVCSKYDAVVNNTCAPTGFSEHVRGTESGPGALGRCAESPGLLAPRPHPAPSMPSPASQGRVTCTAPPQEGVLGWGDLHGHSN